MKRLKNINLMCCLLALFFLYASCSQEPIRYSYVTELPALPLAWDEMLGTAHWRLEWVNQEGNWTSWEGKNAFPALSFMQEWTTPVLAWPFWPEKGLFPEQMQPCGALFPWDVSGNKIILSWEAGIDAFFWRCLALFFEHQTSGSTPRVPWYFDWPRFRDLMKSENISSEVRQNPWLADWSFIAQRTVQSGFDRRRITAQSGTLLSVFLPELTASSSNKGLWAGSSPFASPVYVNPGQALHITVREMSFNGAVETWVSETGFLRVSGATWLFNPWP